MKKTISILILLILIPTLCFAGALQEKQTACIAKKNAAAPASCDLYDELTGTNDNTPASESDGYVGQGFYNPATNITVCRLGFNFYTDPGGATVTMAVYTNSSNNLGSVVVSATGAITGTGWKYLDVTPTALSNGTQYHIVAKVGGATVRLYDSDTTALDEGYLTVWDASGTKVMTHSTYDAGVRIYSE